MLERVDDVVLVHELKPRVEPEHHRHERQPEHAGEIRVDVRSEHMRAAQHRDRDLGPLVGEVRDGLLGLDDVALDHARRRVGPAHALGEEGRVVLLGAVVVGRALEDELAHRRVGAGAGGEDVHRPDDVVLARRGAPR